MPKSARGSVCFEEDSRSSTFCQRQFKAICFQEHECQVTHSLSRHPQVSLSRRSTVSKFRNDPSVPESVEATSCNADVAGSRVRKMGKRKQGGCDDVVPSAFYEPNYALDRRAACDASQQRIFDGFDSREYAYSDRKAALSHHVNTDAALKPIRARSLPQSYFTTVGSGKSFRSYMTFWKIRNIFG